MNKKINILLGVILVLFLTSLNMVAADGLSIQLKRTNPGVANVKSAELIFDVVQTDLTSFLEGFLLCRSPDDVTISSTLGIGSGSGAQYVSPMFKMNKGPSQKFISMTIDSSIEGDMRTGCIIKYIPFKTQEITTEYFDNESNTTKIISETKKTYIRMNGELIDVAEDNDYREIRLDKTVPFVKKQTGVDTSCPEGQTTCNSDEVVVSMKKNWFIFAFGCLVVLLVFSLIFMLGRSSK
jgi:hypothetical protein